MASHQVAIAKASLAAGLLRPDPTSVSRDEITALHNTINGALSHCSSANIQTCKSWLLRYVISSTNRISLLAKYLAALSGSFEDNNGATQPGTQPGSSVKRKRLHILYLLNDLFHHTKYHYSSMAAFSGLSGSLQPHIVDILSYASSYDREKHPKHHKRLGDLLDIWQEHGYFGAEYMDKLREVVAHSAVSGPVRTSSPGANTGEPNRKTTKDVPFVMPPTHGDPSTPYYDLPAGNIIPHIIPNSTIPLRPDMIKPLQFLAGPADEKLATALKTFLKDVNQIYEPGGREQNDDEIVDIDELGQTVIRDVLTGDILEGETYYGWSRSFCQQMKKRNARGSSPRRSESRSRSRSHSPTKRRRYSDSDDSRDRSSRSRSPRRGRYESRSRSRSSRRGSARDRSYSPAPPPQHQHPQQYQAQHSQQYQHNTYTPPAPPPQPPQMPFPRSQAFPPPPPNYQGSWPPPPPPQMPNFPNFPPPFQQMQPQMPPQIPPGAYNLPPHLPGGRGWHPQPPPPPPSGRGWR
ncbi:hypothetical protein BJX99DRAFT_224413 [Aspergillus californicus]